MQNIKEKPKGAKTKKSAEKTTTRSQPVISAKQAAKLLKDKYVHSNSNEQGAQFADTLEAALKQDAYSNIDKFPFCGKGVHRTEQAFPSLTEILSILTK